jgi:hypothetical protein
MRRDAAYFPMGQLNVAQTASMRRRKGWKQKSGSIGGLISLFLANSKLPRACSSPSIDGIGDAVWQAIAMAMVTTIINQPMRNPAVAGQGCFDSLCFEDGREPSLSSLRL